jgi:hypothetical protein
MAHKIVKVTMGARNRASRYCDTEVHSRTRALDSGRLYSEIHCTVGQYLEVFRQL